MAVHRRERSDDEEEQEVDDGWDDWMPNLTGLVHITMDTRYLLLCHPPQPFEGTGYDQYGIRVRDVSVPTHMLQEFINVCKEKGISFAEEGDDNAQVPWFRKPTSDVCTCRVIANCCCISIPHAYPDYQFI